MCFCIGDHFGLLLFCITSLLYTRDHSPEGIFLLRLKYGSLFPKVSFLSSLCAINCNLRISRAAQTSSAIIVILPPLPFFNDAVNCFPGDEIIVPRLTSTDPRGSCLLNFCDLLSQS